MARADRGSFEPYFIQFERHSVENGRDTFGDDTIPIVFATLGDQEAGRCEWHFIKGRQVLIDPEKWKILDEGSREALIFHELGHCLLKRTHAAGEARIPDLRSTTEKGPLDSESNFTGPKSLMNPTSVAGSIYLRNRDYYLNELFGTLP